MGDWDTNWSRDVLERIVALLFSLAGLADLAAGLPAHRRRQVLGILAHGEAEARAFVIGAGAPALTDGAQSVGDATNLAVRLRALALCVLLACRSALPGAASPPAGRHRLAGGAGCRPPPPAFDTS
jgi:hypothetical protein